MFVYAPNDGGSVGRVESESVGERGRDFGQTRGRWWDEGIFFVLLINLCNRRRVTERWWCDEERVWGDNYIYGRFV